MNKNMAESVIRRARRMGYTLRKVDIDSSRRLWAWSPAFEFDNLYRSRTDAAEIFDSRFLVPRAQDDMP
jgi:hypothetical protein